MKNDVFGRVQSRISTLCALVNDPKRIGHANALADSAEADVHALRRSHRAWQWIAAGSWAWAVGGMAMYVAILMGWWTP